METTTSAGQYFRELTKTEVKIAVAQIEDRLERVLNAQDELYRFLEAPCADGVDDESQEEIERRDREYDAFMLRLRQKYELPDGVNIRDLAECCNSAQARGITKVIPHWVMGQLSEDFVRWMMIFNAMEWNEYDYGWVFLEQPMWFYDNDRDGRGEIQKAVDREMVEIGTRSKKKWHGMDRFVGPFNEPFGKLMKREEALKMTARCMGFGEHI